MTERRTAGCRRGVQLAVVAFTGTALTSLLTAQVVAPPGGPANAPTVLQATPAAPTVTTRPAAPGVINVPANQPVGPSGKYRCDKPTYEGGEIWSGEDINAVFVIHNDGDTPLQIPTAQGNCGCTVATWDKTIEPGKEGKVQATVKTRGLPAHETVKTITLRTSDPKSPAPVLQIKAKIKARVQLDPPSVVFGKIDPKTPLSKTVTITNNTEQPLKLEKVPMLQGVAFTAELKALEEGKKYELLVTADLARLRDGMNYAQVNLKTGLTSDPDVYVPISATKPAIIDVTPSPLISVATPTDALVKRDLILTYNGEGPMKIIGAPQTTDPAITATIEEIQRPANPAAPAAAEPGKSYKLSVSIAAGYDPPVPATQPAMVTVRTDVEQKPTLEVKVQAYPKPKPVNQVVADSLVGKPAPVETIKDASGQNFVVGANGRLTVITFWASWCRYCKLLLPNLQKLSQTYASKGVDFKLVSLDQTATPEQVAKIAKDLGVTLPLGFDAKQVSGQKYGANRFPMTFLLNRTGIVEAVDHGGNADGPLKEQLDILLAGGTRDKFPKPAVAQNQPATRPVVETPPSSPNPTLVVDSLTQDIGRHKPGATSQYNIFVRNGGAQPLNITGVTATEGLKIGTEYVKVLQPGGSGSIPCQFVTPTTPGQFTHRVTIASNDPSKPQVAITLNGTARRFLELEPAAGVDFGKKPATFEMDRMATITYYGEGAVNYLSTESSSPQFSAQVKPLRQGPSVMLLVSAKGPFEIGEHKATITVKTDCKEQPTLEVPVTLFQPPRIDIAPAIVSVPKVQRIQDSTVTITNNGKNPLSILAVRSSTQKIRWQFYPEPDGMSYKLRLTLLPGFAASPDGEKLTIKTDDTEFGEIVIPVKAQDAAGEATKGISRLP